MLIRALNRLEYYNLFEYIIRLFFSVCRGVAYLTNLLHSCDIVHTACLVNEKGEIMGHIKIAIQTKSELLYHDENCK